MGEFIKIHLIHVVLPESATVFMFQVNTNYMSPKISIEALLYHWVRFKIKQILSILMQLGVFRLNTDFRHLGKCRETLFAAVHILI